MIRVATPSRSWAGVAWMLIAAGLLAALVFGNTVVLAAALSVAVVAGLWLLGGQVAVPAASPSAATRVAGAAQPVGNARKQRSVVLADGTVQQALVVHADAVDGYQAVLTLDGYSLVDAEGRVVYALARESRVQASEPVVVTIFDTEDAMS